MSLKSMLFPGISAQRRESTAYWESSADGELSGLIYTGHTSCYTSNMTRLVPSKRRIAARDVSLDEA